MRRWIPCRVFFAAALLFATPVVAQEGDRFELFTDCEPVHTVIEKLPRAAKRIRVNQDRLQALVEAALLGARIPITETPAHGHYLYLNLNVVGEAFAWDMEFKKQVIDPISGEKWMAATWSTGGLGTHGGDGTYVLSTIRSALDEFVAEYLRSNLAECTFESRFQHPA